VIPAHSKAPKAQLLKPENVGPMFEDALRQSLIILNATFQSKILSNDMRL
jgi:hypothetical protein